jgi:hypothetical protein
MDCPLSATTYKTTVGVRDVAKVAFGWPKVPCGRAWSIADTSAWVANAVRGRWEHFWDSSQASAVLLEDEAAQLDKVVYTLTNPVGLVDKAADWPGDTAPSAPGL